MAFSFLHACGTLKTITSGGTVTYHFPFGHQHHPTPPQRSKGKAEVFVVGVYASAVHAAWHGPDGHQLCQALAVAPEPRSFWDGRDAEERVQEVAATVPSKAGSLRPAHQRFNGPSGCALMEHYLEPLGSPECWITDLHPGYYLSEGNAAAIERHYKPLAEKLSLPTADLPSRPGEVKPGQDRLSELAREFLESEAEVVVTLGNEPIRALFEEGRDRLSMGDYGRLEERLFLGRYPVKALHLVHPRRAAALGRSSEAWGRVHAEWVQMAQDAGGLMGL